MLPDPQRLMMLFAAATAAVAEPEPLPNAFAAPASARHVWLQLKAVENGDEDDDIILRQIEALRKQLAAWGYAMRTLCTARGYGRL